MLQGRASYAVDEPAEAVMHLQIHYHYIPIQIQIQTRMTTKTYNILAPT
jgi:hypothetical protein